MYIQGDMSKVDDIAKSIINTVSLDNLSVETLIPVIGTLCSHLSEVESLTGQEKKSIVIRCLDIVVDQMGFPQKNILRPMIDTVAPPAIDAIIKAAKTVEIDIAHVFTVSRARHDEMLVDVQSPIENTSTITKTKSLFQRPQPPKIVGKKDPRRWRLPATHPERGSKLWGLRPVRPVRTINVTGRLLSLRT